MRNVTIHQIDNGFLVAFSHDKKVWEYAFRNIEEMNAAIQKFFAKHELPT